MKKLLLFAFFLIMWGGYKFAMPAEDLLVKSISRTDQIVEILIFCFAALIIFLNIFKRIIIHKPLLPKPLFEGYSIHILFLYSWALLSSIFSYYPYYSFSRAGQYLVAIILIGYLIEEIPDYKKIINTIFYFSVLNLLYVVVCFFFFPDLIESSEEGRIIGGGIFKNDNGVVPFIVSMFSFCYYLTVKKRLLKFINISIFIVSLIFLLLYQTRNILYQTPFYILLILFYYEKISFKSLLKISLAAVILIGLINYGLPIIELYTRGKAFVSESRVDTWKVIVENKYMVPFFGYGFLGTPAFLLPFKQRLEGARILITADPHNYFLTAYTEFGILGFIYSIIFIFIMLYLLIQSFKKSKFIPRNIYYPCLVSIILQGIISSFVTNFIISPISFYTISTLTCIMLLNKITYYTDVSATHYFVEKRKKQSIK